MLYTSFSSVKFIINVCVRITFPREPVDKRVPAHRCLEAARFPNVKGDAPILCPTHVLMNLTSGESERSSGQLRSGKDEAGMHASVSRRWLRGWVE